MSMCASNAFGPFPLLTLRGLGKTIVTLGLVLSNPAKEQWLKDKNVDPEILASDTKPVDLSALFLSMTSTNPRSKIVIWSVLLIKRSTVYVR